MSTPPPSHIAALIAQAAKLINQGQWGHAEQALVQALGAQPAEPDGLQLLGLVRANQGRGNEAEALYRRSLALRPKQPNVQVNLARLLAASGRAPEAIALLRATLRAKPDFFEAALALAQAQQAAGDVENAERNFRLGLKLQPNGVLAMLGLGALFNETGRAAEGEALMRKALEQPSTPPGLRAALEQNLGVSLMQQRRNADALAQFDIALAHAPDLPLADANRANALQHLGRHDEAIAAFRRALAKNPLHLTVHQELNALLYRMGRDGEFLRSYDEAARRVPDAAALWVSKGGLLARTEHFDEARDCFARAAATAPQSVAVQNGLALAYAGLKQFDAAIAAYETSLTLRPDDPVTQVNLAGVLLQMDEAKRALQLTQTATARQPHDQAALAMHELALRANGDGRAERLSDYERHVQIFDLAPPEGFSSMAEFNAALNEHLDGLHKDSREHIDQTLRRGTQTLEPLFDGGNALIAALRARIEEAVGAYVARMEDGTAHPLSGRRANGFRFTGSWSSRLHDQGFHTNHIHPKGWISSCYYVDVPGAVSDDEARQGWIKFGEPHFACLRDPVRRMVKPVPGRLVLFPSYMWHGTVPFHAASARTTIAFDAIPV